MLLSGMVRAQTRIVQYKEQVRQYYYRVMLSGYGCPRCGDRLQISAPSCCRCSCGKKLDPTLVIQRSACCDATLRRRRHHYACSSCGRVTPSRFLFDERVFNASYFRDRMHQSRENRQRRLDHLKEILRDARSNPLTLDRLPGADLFSGLEQDLNAFLGKVGLDDWPRDEDGVFRLEDYRRMIMDRVEGCIIRFSAIPALIPNPRLDLARRFLTLTFMWQDGEVELTQRGNDVAVEGR